jgi:hypothetical protein
MTYACSAWELAAVTYGLKLQRLQINILRIIRSFPKCTPVRDLHTVFNLPHVYNYTTKLCRQQAEVIQNRENKHIQDIRKGEARQKILEAETWLWSSLRPF